jgi:hypothetical protein
VTWLIKFAWNMSVCQLFVRHLVLSGADHKLWSSSFCFSFTPPPPAFCLFRYEYSPQHPVLDFCRLAVGNCSGGIRVKVNVQCFIIDVWRESRYLTFLSLSLIYREISISDLCYFFKTQSESQEEWNLVQEMRTEAEVHGLWGLWKCDVSLPPFWMCL